ncbi:hypothetical protein F4777DRAFT_362849 [Nemania sp. FL0916]|nr:hypothetical protein F4777DRAFT_362849 [Nemania sp. FL0916]
MVPPPTLDLNWAPTVDGCLGSTDYWIWSYNLANQDARTVLGGPSQTTDCFSTWGPNITFAATGCPSHYTPACTDTKFGAVTCCPSAYFFSCQPETWTFNKNHAEDFRCQSEYGNTQANVVTVTDLSKGGTSIQTRKRAATQHLAALAIIYSPPPSTTPSSSTSQPTSVPAPLPTSTSESSPTHTPSSGGKSTGLSSGAAAGIGIGAGAAVVLLALLFWFIRRRKKARAPAPEVSHYPAGVAPSIAPTAYTYTTHTSHPIDDPRGMSPQYSGHPSSSASPPTDESPGLSHYSGAPLIKEPVPTPKELPADEGPRFELYGDPTGMQQQQQHHHHHSHSQQYAQQYGQQYGRQSADANGTW